MLQEYPLLLLCPLDVLPEDIYLNLLAAGYVVEAVKHRPNYTPVNALRLSRTGHNPLSLAVFAFAVVDTNDRESVITSATPFAFLSATMSMRSQ